MSGSKMLLRILCDYSNKVKINTDESHKNSRFPLRLQNNGIPLRVAVSNQQNRKRVYFFFKVRGFMLWFIPLFALLFCLAISNIFPLLRLFFRFVLNVFFREIKIRGSWKIPVSGPVLFAVAPHANQFVDPMMLLVTCGRPVGFLIVFYFYLGQKVL